ncbi:hypothetical protein LXA43DRAFT_1181380 [Ganoderma leucocontextum]|nr:hypothetical protein LXA43DRAFT_1181380 [Ganoderma leucocontextum]
MDGKIVVIDYDTMMDDHVPSPNHDPGNAYFESSFKFKHKVTSESKFYQPFAKAANNAWLKDTNFKIVVTSATPDPSDPSKQRLDLAVYTLDSAPGDDDPANWSAVELSIEVKLEEVSDDPFDDDAITFQPNSSERKKNLGQLCSYSSLVFDHQQRTHHFTIIILGQCARIIRWDRSGALVTKKFNYVQHPWMLGRFLWRFAHMTAVQRGHDPTATRVLTTSDDYKLMKERADVPQKNAQGLVVNEHARLLFKASVSNSSAQWWKLRVDDTRTGPRYFLVGEPHFQASGLAGRATHGYVAVDLADPRGALVFLKDAWRVAHEGIEREGHILCYLNEKKVERVPTLVCHGDVRVRKGEKVVGEAGIDVDEDAYEEQAKDEEEDEAADSDDEQEVDGHDRLRGRIQQTVSQKYWTARRQGAQCPMKTHRHYRIVVKEVGLPMSYFKNAKELVYLVARGISAHDQAYKAGVLHRDISAGNVLIQIKEVVRNGKIVRTRDALLTDWELSKRLDQAELDPRQPDRTGTWQFMSANSLSNPWRVMMVEDEIESFFHLLLFYAIRYLPHNCQDVGMFLDEYFDGYTKTDGQYFCGVAKWAAMIGGRISLYNNAGRLTFYLPTEPDNKSLRVLVVRGLFIRSFEGDSYQVAPINTVFARMLKWLQAHYALTNEQKNPTAGPNAAPALDDDAEEEHSAEPTEEEMWFVDSYGMDDEEEEDEDEARDVDELSPERRAALKKMAAKLKEHKHVINALGRAQFRPNKFGPWPEGDKVPDQLRSDFRPDKDPEPQPEPGVTLGSKRASLHDAREADMPPAKRRSTRSRP